MTFFELWSVILALWLYEVRTQTYVYWDNGIHVSGRIKQLVYQTSSKSHPRSSPSSSNPEL